MIKRKFSDVKSQREKKRQVRECSYESFFPQWPIISCQHSNSITNQLSKIIFSLYSNDSTEPTMPEQNQIDKHFTKIKYPFVVGLREVTKTVKRNKVEFVMITQSQKRFLHNQYLLNLCIEKNIPIGSVQGLTLKLSRRFQIRSVMVVAVLKNSTIDQSAIHEIKSFLKPASMLKAQNLLTAMSNLPNTPNNTLLSKNEEVKNHTFLRKK